MKLEILPIKTKKFLPPKSNIYEALVKLPKIKDGDILFITSKILGIHQGRTIPVTNTEDKHKIAREVADMYLPKFHKSKHNMQLTIVDSVLIPSSGIDESNGNGYYILWPKNTSKLLREIHAFLIKKNKIKSLGIISTDSHTTPLRRGVSGIATGFYGFNPIIDLRGQPDIFKRKLKFTQVNLLDSLAGLAVLHMGEAADQTPILVLRGYKNIQFGTKYSYKKYVYPWKEDIYYPLLKHFKKSA